ncbi:hypothetical protein COCSADRAFT_172200 [Bipolaris sorokiniana ND90Pr]|uniref:Uncharacterized protein n=1 Tax=Cochliobolus sativus (strain ND90Pr / ATCC 201652) TaxID=665912 RepID=M2T0N2_COCSN|nr:uncharacterized protein COCSADRAFT_172200 [Bipolaris sorokiniana ND90Pr]EMD62771.1 hypothetical protein COCSADRAFT_172200 [Bipolaris sorokiniana ND90Pr]
MMYSGMTLTTTPLTLTMCEMGLPTGSPGGSVNTATVSRLTGAPPLLDATDAPTDSASGLISSTLTLSVAVSSSIVPIASDGTYPGADGISSVGQSIVGPSVSDISDTTQRVSDAVSSILPTGSFSNTGGPSTPVATAGTSNISGVSSVAGLSPGGNTPTQIGLRSETTFPASTQTSTSAGLYKPTGVLLGMDSNPRNGTISLSPLSIDALKLALFLKNLGVWVFNESRIVELSSLSASLVADIAVLDTLRTLLIQSGNMDVPSCKYDLLKNMTELSFLMVTLKSIDLGVFMSMAEAADRLVAILLSSIASVDAKYIALLGDHTHYNASVQSFDTPATPAWAYNIALRYSQPGSCSVQLPLPILPKLTINNSTSAHVQPGTKVNVEWGAAAILSGTAFAVLRP